MVPNFDSGLVFGRAPSLRSGSGWLRGSLALRRASQSEARPALRAALRIPHASSLSGNNAPELHTRAPRAKMKGQSGHPGLLTNLALVVGVGPDQKIIRKLDDLANFHGVGKIKGEEAVIIGKSESAGVGGGRFAAEAGGGILKEQGLIGSEGPSVVGAAGWEGLGAAGNNKRLEAPGAATAARK